MIQIDCISGRHTFAISYDLRIRPCFSIDEKNGQSFDGKNNMSITMDNMKKYIEDMRKK